MNLTAAPDFPAGLEWLNTDHPLSISELAGRIVLLCFGTFACSNCMRMVPELRRLEGDHPELVVIDVHAPGFESPEVTGSLQETIRCAGIDYPVAIDRDYLLWQAFGIRNWPTFVLIDPEGNVLGKTAGKGSTAAQPEDRPDRKGFRAARHTREETAAVRARSCDGPVPARQDHGGPCGDAPVHK